MMKTLFLKEPPTILEDAPDSSAAQQLESKLCDLLVAFTTAPETGPPTLTFLLELATPLARELLLMQRLLAEVMVRSLGEGFGSRGPHVTFAGAIITQVDFLQRPTFCNARIRFYMPTQQKAGEAADFSLTGLRLPSSAPEWASVVLSTFATEMQEISDTVLSLKVARGRLREHG